MTWNQWSVFCELFFCWPTNVLYCIYYTRRWARLSKLV